MCFLYRWVSVFFGIFGEKSWGFNMMKAQKRYGIARAPTSHLGDVIDPWLVIVVVDPKVGPS